MSLHGFTEEFAAQPQSSGEVSPFDLVRALDKLLPVHGWTPAREFALVAAVFRGLSMDLAAAQLQVAPQVARVRFLALTAPIATYGWQGQRHLTINGQRLLIEALTARAAARQMPITGGAT